MGKDIDWDYIRELGIDVSSPEAMARTDACLKKVFGITGPRISVRDLPHNGPERPFVVDVDFDVIEERTGLRPPQKRAG